MEHHAAPGRLAEDRDPIRVAAEHADVLVHPLECGDRVAQAAVRRPAHRPGIEEPERAEPVVARDDDDVLFDTEAPAVVDRLRRRPGRERAAREPHEHRALLGTSARVGEHVQCEAAGLVGRPPERAGHETVERPADRLGRGRCVGGREPGAVPRRDALGCLETRRARVRNAAKHVDRASVELEHHAGEPAARRRDLGHDDEAYGAYDAKRPGGATDASSTMSPT